MRGLALLFLLISFAYCDFSISYKINNKLVQTVLYKDSNHILFIIKDGSEIVEKLHILNGKKYISFKDNGIEHIYEISDELSDLNNSNSSINLPQYTILKKDNNTTIHNYNAQKWTIKDSDGETEEILVTDNKTLYNNLLKTIEALKNILPANKEDSANIFKIGKNHIILKSKNLQFLSSNSDDINITAFNIEHKAKISAEVEKNLSNKIAKCFSNVCCGNSNQESQNLFKIVNKKYKNWTLKNIAKCDEESQKELESAIYKDGNSSVTIEMTSSNSQYGKIDSLFKEGIEVTNIQKINLYGYNAKRAYIPSVDATILDIEMPNTIISIYTKGKEELIDFAKNIIKFKIKETYSFTE